MNFFVHVPDNVKNACKVLHDSGYQVNLVGGCVRDSLLGKKPKDYDITTNALPEQIREIFKDAGAYILDIDGAEEHGVIFVNYHHERFEIATYRSDGLYEDKRHCQIKTGVPLMDDLSRRDFTINAMAFEPFSETLSDFYGGEKDLSNKIIRTVGDPYKRFSEDALRILRMYRFSAQLGFEIDENTKKAAISLKENLNYVSMERKREELTRIMKYNPYIFKEMDKDGVLNLLLPDLHEAFLCEQNTPYHFGSVGDHTLSVIDHCEKEDKLLWTALVHDLGKMSVKSQKNGKDTFYGHGSESEKIAENVLSDYKFPNDFIYDVKVLTKCHDDEFANEKHIRSFIGKYGDELFLELMKIKDADARGHNETYIQNLLDKNNEILSIYRKIRKKYPNMDFSLKGLSINGNDLLELGFLQDKTLGKALEKCHEKVLENPERNNKDYLLNYASQLYDSWCRDTRYSDRDR